VVSWPDYTHQLKSNLSSGRFVCWLFVSAATRGVHTQVVTLWPLVSREIAPDCGSQSFNALISFAAYAAAAVVVLIPAKFSQLTAQQGQFLIPPAFLVGAVLLVGVASAQSLWSLALVLVVYHSISELVLTIASAKIASSTMTCSDQSGQVEAHYVSAMALKYFISLLVETVAMLTIWPRWGELHNILGLSLSVRQQFYGLAILLMIAFSVSMLTHCQGIARKMTTQCADYEHVAS